MNTEKINDASVLGKGQTMSQVLPGSLHSVNRYNSAKSSSFSVKNIFTFKKERLLRSIVIAISVALVGFAVLFKVKSISAQWAQNPSPMVDFVFR